MRSVHIKKLILAALFLAMAMVLPFLTGQIPEVGSMLCPMHIPALLCGFFCGWPWGLMVGVVAPLLRSVTFGMPPMFPVAICMAFELATYGAVSGSLYQKLPKKKSSIYVALLVAMVAGRLLWGAARFVCAGLDVSAFGNYGLYRIQHRHHGRLYRSHNLCLSVWYRRRCGHCGCLDLCH